MGFLNKTVVRVIVSLIAGQLINEILSRPLGGTAGLTGIDNPVFTLIYAAIIYLLLTGINKGSQKKLLLSKISGYVLNPEVPGQLGENTVMDTSVHPPIVSYLHLIIEGWMGDDLLQNFPVFLVTKRLGNELKNSNLDGFDLRECEIESSEKFEVFHQNIPLPSLIWLNITGTTENADFHINGQNSLVVSENAFAMLNKFNLKHCEIKKRIVSKT